MRLSEGGSPFRAFWVRKIEWVFIRKQVDIEPEAKQNVSTVQLAVKRKCHNPQKPKITNMTTLVETESGIMGTALVHKTSNVQCS